MRLILLRHGKSVEKTDWHDRDEDRPLTKDGVEHATQVLRLTAPLVHAVEIWTSPWLRARQTAELASGIWKLPLREMDWLAAEAQSAAERAGRLRASTNVVLVGHDPDLSDLAQVLCGGRIELKKCGMAFLDGEPKAGGMTLGALLVPKTLLSLAGK
jgi:phosphohistidine phosphatase